MASHIAFINNKDDCDLLKRLYSDSISVRIPMTSSNLTQQLPAGPKIWIDAEVDAFHSWPPPRDKKRKPGEKKSKLMELLESYDCSSSVCDQQFQEKPNRSVVEKFTFSVLNRCSELKPDWISIPQLPTVVGTKRNKINRMFADAAANWRTRNSFHGKLILPIIITHFDQIRLKQNRDNILKHVVGNVSRAGADGVWVVYANLNDRVGSKTLGRERLPKLIEFHSELQAGLSDDVFVIAGPYWGMNIVLWARGLATYPAIGLGRGFEYFIPGGILRKSSARIALPSLRRLAVVSPALQEWMEKAVTASKSHPKLRRELDGIIKRMSAYYDNEIARVQVADFYKTWLNKFEEIPPAGRALALYQDLSDALVTGAHVLKGLPLPMKERPARSAEMVAQQFMLNCL